MQPKIKLSVASNPSEKPETASGSTEKTLRKQAMNLRKNNLAAMLSCALILIVLSACGAMPSDGPLPIARKPKPTPLPAAILQIDLKPSTDTLSRASKWSQDSEVILQSGTMK